MAHPVRRNYKVRCRQAHWQKKGREGSQEQAPTPVRRGHQKLAFRLTPKVRGSPT
ncbi:hypothetical protein GCM10007388_33520 [Pseudoduganella plicata]|uniref:Uncharacterized protein n=1 Tax=Pseudoduganella plicata TaxID=321984 RepID=A0AA87Y4N2_9BURK|nr:hypothetical protein GCM10007388_33520 [Pseudoduganella plicata]